MNQVLNENEQLLEQVISKDIVYIIVNYSVDNTYENVHECEKYLKLETKLQKDFVEKEIYDKLFKSFTTLEKYCISLEVNTQLNQKIFQRDNFVSNQSAPSFDQYFKINELKAQSQEKDTVIKKLKERIKSLSGNMNENKEKVLVITTLKDDLRKLKGKSLVDNAIMKHTIDPEMLNIDMEPITPKLLNKKKSHSAYIKHTQEEATVLRDLVEQVKSKYPLDHSLESAYRTAHVQHSKLNANSELKCVKCNGCMLSDNHDLCVLDFINNVNAHNKSKSRPTGRAFTIVGNACPLTRITTTTEVPLRKPTALDNETPKPVVTLVYTRKPRKSKTNVPVSKSKVFKYVSANKKEPRQSWGSIVSDVPYSSLDECRNDHMAKILGYGDYHIGNVMISIVKTNKVNHAVETDMVKLMVEIESFGMSADELDKETKTSDGLQPKQADMSCVHALNEPHLHEIYVVPSKHEADQCLLCENPEPV
ncbi:hypothetical protein Tco_1539285 [Tanacetum coccineum]